MHWVHAQTLVWLELLLQPTSAYNKPFLSVSGLYTQACQVESLPRPRNIGFAVSVTVLPPPPSKDLISVVDKSLFNSAAGNKRVLIG